MKPPHPIDVRVGTNIRLYRQAARMSQAELAGRLGITFQQLQRYEKGTNKVGAARLLIIANLLKIPVATLYEGIKTPQKRARPLVQFLLRRDAFRLAEAFDKIRDQRLRNSLVALIVNLSEP